MKIGEFITFPDCQRCHHGSHGIITGVIYDGPNAGPVVKWDPPPSDCGCSCHTPWRILNRVPVVAEAAA